MPKMKEMVSGCCVCAEEVGWVDNPLIYCDGPQCDVAVHQGCYGILEVPESDWFCSKCKSALVKVKESYPAQTEKDWQEKNEPSTDQLLNSPKCELCPHKYGALKKTNSNMWAHVICALYIPEVRFGNCDSMEPVILRDVPLSRYTQNCCLCNLPTTADASDSDSTSPTHKRAKITSKVNGACMPCNRQGCTRNFHVTCAQLCGLLCEEGGESKNVKYCGYCTRHLKDAKQDDQIKMIPSYIPPGTTLADHGIIVRRKNKDVETSNSEDSSSDSNSTRSDGSSPDNVNTHESNSSTTIKTESALIKEEPQQCHNHFLRQDGLSDNNSTRSDKDRLNKTNGSFISTKQENGYATTKEESLRIKANEMINNIVKGVKNVKYRNEMNIISNSKYDSPLTINASLSSFFSNSAQSSAHSSPKIVNTSISHLHNSHDSCSTAASSPLDALLTAAEMDKKNSLAYMNPHVSSIGHHNISVLTNNNVNGHKNNGHNNNGHNINGHSINEHYNNEHNNGHTNNGGVGTLAITNSIHLPRTIALSKQQLLNQAKLASSALNSPSSISNNSEYDSIELIIDGETFSDYGVVSSSSNIVKAKPNLKRKSTDARYPNGHEEKKRKNGPETNGSVMREVNNSSHPQGPPTSKGSKKSRTAKVDYAMSRDLSSSMKDLKSQCKPLVDEIVQMFEKERLESKINAAAAASSLPSSLTNHSHTKKMLSSTVSPIPNQDRETISRSDFGSSHERTSSSKRNSISIVSSNLAMAVEDRISASITATINNNLVALNGDVHPSTSSASTTDPVHNISTTPNSLEELLEKQWGKGIQLFSHIKGPCDLSQLLTCLEELQKESKAMQQEEIDLNKRLEHLTNVNTRLRLTLKSSQEAKDPVHESNKFPVEEKTLGSTVVSSPASLVADTPQVVINNVPSHPAVMSPVMSPAPSHVASSIGSVQSPKLNSTPVASVTNVTPPLHIAPSANIPNIATPVSVPQQRTLTPHVPMQITPSPAAVPSTISNTINSTVNNTINSSVRPATSTPNHTNLPFSVVNNLNTNSISNQLSLLAQATGQSGNGFGSAEDIQNQIRTAAMASKFPPVATRPESRTNQQAINFMSRNNASIDSPMVSTASQQQVHQQVQQQVQQQLQQQQQQQLAELARVQALNSNSHNLNNTLAATSFSKTMSSDNSPRASVQTSYGSTNAPVNGMNMMNVNNLANQFLLNRSSASGTPMTAPPTHAGIGNSAEMNIRDILSYLAGPLNGLERGSALTNLNNSLTGANNNNHPNTNGTTQLSLDQQHNILSTLFNFQSNPQNPNLLMTNYLAHAAQQQQQQQRTQQLSNMFNHQLTANLMNVQGTMSSPSIVNQGLATGTPPPTVQQLNSGNIMSSALAK